LARRIPGESSSMQRVALRDTIVARADAWLPSKGRKSISRRDTEGRRGGDFRKAAEEIADCGNAYPLIGDARYLQHTHSRKNHATFTTHTQPFDGVHVPCIRPGTRRFAERQKAQLHLRTQR
jgi:hypothetical protein